LKLSLKCNNKQHVSSSEVYGHYWLMKNYIKAEHGPLHCATNVTYTTHADYLYLDNLVPLLERWLSPVSLALYAPGDDFDPTLHSILWLRQCHKSRHLVRELVSFHIYFMVTHIPRILPTTDTALKRKIDCSKPPPYVNTTHSSLYRVKMNLTYPVNMGRNLARGASLTHFVLASDIELYPTPGLVPAYLKFYSRKVVKHSGEWLNAPVVHVLRIFEVQANATIPTTKSQLQEMLVQGEAVPFHLKVCRDCHEGPLLEEWMNDTDSQYSQDLNVFNKGTRLPPHVSWEPIFIGSVNDPPYDERLSWEGKRDKMTQGYIMCILGYQFHVLDKAFLVHKPGITADQEFHHSFYTHQTNRLISLRIIHELRIKYGRRKGCEL
ncbi:hypothetical protein KR018_005019, partial [Drosophila ironensis]